MIPAQADRESDSQLRTAHEANTNALAEVGAVVRSAAEVNSKLLYQGPLLSECLEEFLEAKRIQLSEESREPAYFRPRLASFLDIVGDKPIADYSEADLTRFAARLQYLPERHTVDPEWKGMSLVQAIEANEKRRNRAESISFTTVRCPCSWSIWLRRVA